MNIEMTTKLFGEPEPIVMIDQIHALPIYRAYGESSNHSIMFGASAYISKYRERSTFVVPVVVVLVISCWINAKIIQSLFLRKWFCQRAPYINI
jgi:hypothetical protein